MISFVYFDVGGVVVRDYSGTDNWTRMKHDMGIRVEDHARFDSFWGPHEVRVCKGADVETLVPLIEQEFNIHLPEGYSLLNDFANRFEKNEPIWPVIENAQKIARVGLLTNMYPNMLDLICERQLMPQVKWDVVIDSSKVGHLKPEEEIYQIAEEKSGAKKNEILFVENNSVNVKAAQDFGWQTFFYDSADMSGSAILLAEFLNLNY